MSNPRPQVLVFDVNETLSDLAPIGRRFREVGAPEHLARLWFTSVLRDGFALAAAGSSQTFADIAAALLRVQLPEPELNRSVLDAVAHVMDGFGELGVHPDVAEGVRALAGAGLRLVTMSNGAVAVAERLLTDAGVVDSFEQLLSVEDAGVWKPARAAYGYAVEHCGVAATDAMLVAVHPWDIDGAHRAGVWKPARAAYGYAVEHCGVAATDAMLVAVHPWDIDGAHRAGLRTAWINRDGGSYPAHLLPADLVASSIISLAEQLRR